MFLIVVVQGTTGVKKLLFFMHKCNFLYQKKNNQNNKKYLKKNIQKF